MSSQAPARAREPALVATTFSALAAPWVALALLVGVGQPLRDARWLPAVALVALGALPVVLGLTAVVGGRPLALLAAGALSTILALPLTSPPTALLLALLVPAALYGVAYLRWQPRPELQPASALRLVLLLLLAAGALFVLAFLPVGREANPLDALAQAGLDGNGVPSPQDFASFADALSSTVSTRCEGIPKCVRLATSSQVGIAGALIMLAAAVGWLLPRARAAGPAAMTTPAAAGAAERQDVVDPRPDRGTADA